MNEFITNDNFIKDSTEVCMNGLWLRRGMAFDYTEQGSNKIVLKESVLPGDSLVIEYIKQ